MLYQLSYGIENKEKGERRKEWEPNAIYSIPDY
jgi:hypothetical protein